MPKRPPALTAAHVARLAARDSQYDVRDGEVPGLLLRVFPSGVKRWGFRARQDGRLRFVLIGGYPELSLEVARKQARKVRARLDMGERPADERAKRRAEPTLGELWAEYRRRHTKSDRSMVEDARRWKRHLTGWENRVASTVPKRDVARLLHRVSESSGPVESNRLRAMLSHLYTWSRGVDLIACDNPAAGLRGEPEAPRERRFTNDEIRRLLAAIAEEPDPIWQGFFLLSMLTGCRRGELLAARWDWVQLDHSPPVLNLPRGTTKQRREHRVPLSSESVQVLEQLPSRRASNFLFPSANGGFRRDPKRAWAAVRERAGLADVHLHDLRHLIGQSLAEAGSSSFVIQRALGHSKIATSARYVDLALETSHNALEQHGARIRALREREE